MTFLQVSVLFYLLMLAIHGITSTGVEKSCSVDGMNCPSSNTLNADPIESRSSSWISNSYNSVVNAFSNFQEAMSEHDVKADDDFADIDVEAMMAQAKELAAMMAADHFEVDVAEVTKRFPTASDMHTDEPEVPVGENAYEYQPVKRREATAVGDVMTIELEDGVETTLIARSLDPPLFEIQNFLNADECDYIISKSKEKGLFVSGLFSNKNVTDKKENIGSSRVSESTFLTANDIDRKFLDRLQNRVSRLVDVPKEVVQWSEELVIGKYEVGGHYHAHLDSTDLESKKLCCFQTICSLNKGKDIENSDCCRLCRYATVLYYLNDVEEGGETAFPIADYAFSKISSRSEEMNWRNLTEHCHDSQVVVKPEKGKAILWYNHFVDKHGYLGGLSKRGYHGGCDVIKGTKWIATNWVSIPTYKHRHVPSKHREMDMSI